MRHLGLHAHACLRGYTLSQGNEPLHETRRQGLFHRVYPGSGIAMANRSESHAFDISARASGAYVETPDEPDLAVAYDGSAFEAMVVRSGLEVVAFYPGNWRKLPYEDFQDAYVLAKP